MRHRDRKINGRTTSSESGVKSGEEVGFEEDGFGFDGREESEDGVNKYGGGEDVHLFESENDETATTEGQHDERWKEERRKGR